MTRAVVVMAKVPRAGRVKTRLAAKVSAEAAVELYRAFLEDVLALVDRAHAEAAGGFDRVLAVADGDPGAMASLTPPGWRSFAQRGRDLGERIAAARDDAGAEQVVILGSDSPTLPHARILEAFAALDHSDAVFGPTIDGGYYLIALPRAQPPLLRDIPWSTAQVMETTRARAAEAGIRLVELAPGYDIDEPEDLARALADAREGSRTRAAIEALLASMRPAD